MSDPAAASITPSARGDGTVAGRVSAGGLAVADATVMIVEGDAPHPDIAAITDAAGGFQLSGLSAGWYNFEARAGQRTARGSVQLGAGESAWLELVLS